MSCANYPASYHEVAFSSSEELLVVFPSKHGNTIKQIHFNLEMSFRMVLPASHKIIILVNYLAFVRSGLRDASRTPEIVKQRRISDD